MVILVRNVEQSAGRDLVSPVALALVCHEIADIAFVLTTVSEKYGFSSDPPAPNMTPRLPSSVATICAARE
jgi:hypothetical protein